MKRLIILASLVLCIPAFGQVRAVKEEDNPCLKSPPTVQTCWDCFQKLLADCDKQNPEGDRRRACYTGANNYFTFCLGRTTVPGQRRAGVESSLPTGTTFDMSSGMVYQLTTDQCIPYDSIKVYLRLMVNGEPVQIEAPSFIVNEGKTTTVAVLPMNVSGNRWVGVVTAFLSRGQIVAGFADSVPVVDALDLNGDSVVDILDLMEASNRVTRGAMTANDFNAYIGEWSAHQK